MEWLLTNWELVVTVLFIVLAVILTGKRLNYWRWANEVAWFAWVEAEKQGLAQGLKGYEKLKIYMETWRQKYLEKWGDQPSVKELGAAEAKAAELSVKEKVYRLANPS